MLKTFFLLLLVYTLPTALLGFFMINGSGFFLLLPLLFLLTLLPAYQSAQLQKERAWRKYLL